VLVGLFLLGSLFRFVCALFVWFVRRKHKTVCVCWFVCVCVLFVPLFFFCVLVVFAALLYGASCWERKPQRLLPCFLITSSRECAHTHTHTYHAHTTDARTHSTHAPHTHKHTGVRGAVLPFRVESFSEYFVRKVCLFVCLFFCLFVCLFVCLVACLFVCLVCVFVVCGEELRQVC